MDGGFAGGFAGLGFFFDFVGVGVCSFLHGNGEAAGIGWVDVGVASWLGGPGDASTEEVDEVVFFLAFFGVGERGCADVDGAGTQCGEDEVEIHLPWHHVEPKH